MSIFNDLFFDNDFFLDYDVGSGTPVVFDNLLFDDDFFFDDDFAAVVTAVTVSLVVATTGATTGNAVTSHDATDKVEEETATAAESDWIATATATTTVVVSRIMIIIPRLIVARPMINVHISSMAR